MFRYISNADVQKENSRLYCSKNMPIKPDSYSLYLKEIEILPLQLVWSRYFCRAIVYVNFDERKEIGCLTSFNSFNNTYAFRVGDTHNLFYNISENQIELVAE